jgi:C-terminal processing protease CtpA/Prc
MYAVYPKQYLDRDIERVKSQLEPYGDVLYFYKQITPLVVKLGDGHTSIHLPFDEPSDFGNALLFPFSVKITYPDKVIRVQNDYTSTQKTIPVGAQITSINKRQASDIVPEMMNYVSGEKDFYRIDLLENLFTPMVYVLYGDSIFDIEYVFNQEKHSIQQVAGVSYKERYVENPSQQDNIGINNQFIFNTLPDKNIGIIKFDVFDDLDKFKVFLDSTFRVLQNENIGNLIIDLRNNGGGDSKLGDELFQYISPVPFAQFGKVVVRYSDIKKEFYRRYYGREVTNPNGIAVYNENPQLNELIENDLRYKGNVYLLISHSTFSSAASFSWAFKYFKMGTVIGEESGGIAVCFGDVICLNLPNSGLSYCISHKRFYQYGATDENVHGTLPDYNVEAEKALDFVVDLITRKK